MKAIWNGEIIAESDSTIIIEGNHYFPPESIKKNFFNTSDKLTSCPWKGLAAYYHVEVAGKVNEDAAWYYPAPSALAKGIKDHIAFWHGVEVTE